MTLVNAGRGGSVMGFMNAALVTVILGGAIYMLYRSIWKNKGKCPDCSGTRRVKKKIMK